MYFGVGKAQLIALVITALLFEGAVVAIVWNRELARNSAAIKYVGMIGVYVLIAAVVVIQSFLSRYIHTTKINQDLFNYTIAIECAAAVAAVFAILGMKLPKR